jgi:hypothetical protein
MIYHDLIIMIIIGGIFVVLGIFGVFWGGREEGAWYSTISERIDVREFLDRSPGRPEPDALRIGAKICFAVGIIVLLVALGFFLWGMSPKP